MTLKQKAALEVAKLVALTTAIGFGTGILLNTVPLAIVGIGAGIIMIVYLLHAMYKIKLSQLETEENLKK